MCERCLKSTGILGRFRVVGAVDTARTGWIIKWPVSRCAAKVEKAATIKNIRGPRRAKYRDDESISAHGARPRGTYTFAHDARTVLINGICHRALRCTSRFMLYARSARFMLRFMLHTECAARLRPARARVHFYPLVPRSLCPPLITSPCRCFVSDFFLLHSPDADFTARRGELPDFHCTFPSRVT